MLVSRQSVCKFIRQKKKKTEIECSVQHLSRAPDLPPEGWGGSNYQGQGGEWWSDLLLPLLTNSEVPEALGLWWWWWELRAPREKGTSASSRRQLKHARPNMVCLTQHDMGLLPQQYGKRSTAQNNPKHDQQVFTQFITNARFTGRGV